MTWIARATQANQARITIGIYRFTEMSGILEAFYIEPTTVKLVLERVGDDEPGPAAVPEGRTDGGKGWTELD